MCCFFCFYFRLPGGGFRLLCVGCRLRGIGSWLLCVGCRLLGGNGRLLGILKSEDVPEVL